MARPMIDALSGRQILAGDEEQDATQPLIAYLVQKLGWNPQQLLAHPQWRVPKTPSSSRAAGYPVDLAFFSSPEHRGDPDHVRIIAECKAPNQTAGLLQLKLYLGMEPAARLGIWFNGQSHVLVYKLPDGDFVENRYAPIPRPTDPLTPAAAARPLRFGDLIPPPNLREIFLRLRDSIAAQDTHVNRDEFILNDLANLLICKIVDEQQGEMDADRPMAFQLAVTREATSHAVRHLFDETRVNLRSVFTDGSDRLHVDDASLETIVRTLQPYRLLGHDRHAVGTAFQVLRGRALKGEEGAYFTPPPLVDCVVSILAPTHSERVIDPACGTGGFLAAALDHVYAQVDASKANAEAKARRKHQWAAGSLVAVDKDTVSVRLCKAYLTLLGDGRSHAYQANSIDRSDWSARGDDLAHVVADGTFQVLMTNPPFGRKLKVSPEIGRREELVTCRRWRKVGSHWEQTDAMVEQQLGVAFYERSLRLLRPGGRLAIVLPETFLFSPAFRWFVDWICRTVTVTHVVDVPMVAFEEFCRAKTCILFVANTPPPPGHAITMAYPRSIGMDKNGKVLNKLDAGGNRTEDLDNEMADAVQAVVGSVYDGKGKETPRAHESRYRFQIQQQDARAKGVLVPRYWWRRDTDRALAEWAGHRDVEIVTLGELARDHVLQDFTGHGSPKGTQRGTGDVPYVKVTDLKNWRINENPSNMIHADIATRLRRNRELRYGDLVAPARASMNIGQFCMVMPWQTHVILTKEVVVLRVLENDRGLDPFLLLALLSLRVVVKQYESLALMQVNREHLGNHWREVKVPIPRDAGEREKVAATVKTYFDSLVAARRSYDALVGEIFQVNDFGTRPS